MASSPSSSCFAAGRLSVTGIGEGSLMAFARREFGESESGARFVPLPSGDHVRMGLACLSGHVDGVHALLRKNPALLHAPCTMAGQNRWVDFEEKRRGVSVRQGMAPMEAAVCLGHWGVIDALLDHHLAVLPGRSPPVPSAREKVWLTGVLRGVIQRLAKISDTASDVVPLVHRLVGLGASPWRATPEGQSAFSVLLPAMVSDLTCSWFDESALGIDLLTALCSKGGVTDAGLGAREQDGLRKALDDECYWAFSDFPEHQQDKYHWLQEKTGRVDAPGAGVLHDWMSTLWCWVFSQGIDVTILKDLARKHHQPGSVLALWLDRCHLEETLSPASALVPRVRL
jgi:hypothetical protein